MTELAAGFIICIILGTAITLFIAVLHKRLVTRYSPDAASNEQTKEE